MSKISVLMSVYRYDSPEYLRVAVESISIKQTLQPDEVILVVDGFVPAVLETEIKNLCTEIPYIKPLWKLNNEGLGKALRDGVEIAANEIIARMDSDDISVPDRFEKQIIALESDPTLSIVGGGMTEFIDLPENIVGSRTVPSTNDDIKSYMKTRCGLNHVTVMFKRSEILRVGNYQDWFWNEDYYLWVRMMIAGCKFANIPDILVNVRSGADQYARRGGRKYFESEKGIQKLMLDNNLISYPRYCFNVFVRFCVQIAMPNWVRGIVFRKLFRQI